MPQKANASMLNEDKPTEQIIPSPDTLIDDQICIENEKPIDFNGEWLKMIYAENNDHYLDFEHNPFVMHIGVKYAAFMDSEDDLNICKTTFGVKDKYRDYRNCSIDLGIYMGRLFIDKDFGQQRIPGDKIIQGIQLILKITALEDGKAIAKLKAIDTYGITLATMKSTRYSAKDWQGYLFPGAHVKFIRIRK